MLGTDLAHLGLMLAALGLTDLVDAATRPTSRHVIGANVPCPRQPPGDAAT
jgi:hypothetical protein